MAQYTMKGSGAYAPLSKGWFPAEHLHTGPFPVDIATPPRLPSASKQTRATRQQSPG